MYQPHTLSTIAGIDLSINSTGITIRTLDSIRTYFIIIKPKDNRKKPRRSDYNIDGVRYYYYDKERPYSDEIQKAKNISNLANVILSVLKEYNVVYCIIEGVSFGSVGKIAELSALNFLVRDRLLSYDISFDVVSPAKWKKAILDNGAASKELSISKFIESKQGKKLQSYEEQAEYKMDDIADSFHISYYISQEKRNELRTLYPQLINKERDKESLLKKQDTSYSLP